MNLRRLWQPGQVRTPTPEWLAVVRRVVRLAVVRRAVQLAAMRLAVRLAVVRRVVRLAAMRLAAVRLAVMRLVIISLAVLASGCLPLDPGDLPGDDDSGDDDASTSPAPTDPPVSPSPTGTPTPPPSDEDGDGYPSTTDCDDRNSAAYPGAAEICDGADNNCDTRIDEGFPTLTWYSDADLDGFGDDQVSVEDCDAPLGYVATAGDCDDQDPFSYSGADELCDELDNDCDLEVDEEVEHTFYPDSDGDGYGVAGGSTTGCTAPSGYAPASGDCDDADVSRYPGALEVCDGVDHNCNGVIGTEQLQLYPDGDGDGYAVSSSTPVTGCDPSPGLAVYVGDCADGNGQVHPALVDGATGSAGGDGTPTHPFATIRQGLDDTDSCDLVLVNPGTYLEPVLLQSRTGLTLQSIGGAAETTIQTSGGQRPLTLDTCQGVAVRGFTLEALQSVTDSGGGAYVGHSSDVILEGLIVKNCTANGGLFAGGGVALESSTGIRVMNSLLEANVARFGAGLSSVSSNAEISGCTFQGNLASDSGGGIFVGYPADGGQQGAVVSVDQSRFTDNVAKASGGGVATWQANTLHIQGSTLIGNEAQTNYGGGLYNPTSVDRCILVGNAASGGSLMSNGGGVQVRQTSSITNSVFMGNSSSYGGAVNLNQFSAGTKFTVTNNTMVDNDAFFGDSLYSYAADYLIMQNNIMVMVEVTGGYNCYNLDGGLVWTIDHNDLFETDSASFGGAAGFTNSIIGTKGNIGLDPKFEAYVAGEFDSADLHLHTGSPAIDTGNPSVGNDPDGTMPDMGAFGGPGALP